MTQTILYKPTNKIRLVTAVSLFDGHAATINIMRRIEPVLLVRKDKQYAH